MKGDSSTILQVQVLPSRTLVSTLHSLFVIIPHFLFSKTNALDVEKESEYCEMVEKIEENSYEKMNVIIDINDIKKKCLVDVSIVFPPQIGK